jgi:hypothetical protein
MEAQELINSFVRLSAAMTVFGMQQLQTAVGNVDPNDAIVKLREVIDAMTNVVNAHIEESRRPTVESMTTLGRNMMDRTWDAINLGTPQPRDLMNVANDSLRRATNGLNEFMRMEKKGLGTEPKAADEVLAN